MAEKLNSHFLHIVNIQIIFEFKRHNLCYGKKKAFVFSPEATRGRIEQNITNARLL